MGIITVYIFLSLLLVSFMGLFFLSSLKKEKKLARKSELEQSYIILKEQKREIFDLKRQLLLVRLFRKKEKGR